MENILDRETVVEGHSFDFNIYYEDTDLSGFVYHPNYLKYFERAREHLIGVSYLMDLMGRGYHFVVTKASLSYLYPARFGDLVRVESSCRFSASPSVPFVQSAHLLINGEKVKELVRAEISLVILDMDNRPVRMPQFALQYFNERALEIQSNG
ncbi:MAG: thioesterase family protein [Oligoflexales bacterium]|nr:thioesterase family protein [Oligoflexales bacterium]